MSGASLDQAQNDGLQLSHCAKIHERSSPNLRELLSRSSRLLAHPHDVIGPLWGPCPGPAETLSQLGHQGVTPLFIAAQRGHGEVVQQLIAAGPLGGLEDLLSEGRKGGHTV